MTGISKQDLLAQVQDPKTKAIIAGLGSDGDEMTSVLFTALLAAYKAQQRTQSRFATWTKSQLGNGACRATTN
jgi:hypothetical protein